jgi:proton glutamate symport protein
MLSFCESLTAVMFKFVGLVMTFAPIGIGAAIAATVGKNGIGVLRHLGLLVLTLYGSLAVFALVVLFPIALLFQVPLRRFLREVKEPWLIAFTTASSEAALPLALRNMERLGVPRRIVSFVLPTGYAFNMDGTTLYLALAAVFVARPRVDADVAATAAMLTLMLRAAWPPSPCLARDPLGISPSSGCPAGGSGHSELMPDGMARTSPNPATASRRC